MNTRLASLNLLPTYAGMTILKKSYFWDSLDVRSERLSVSVLSVVTIVLSCQLLQMTTAAITRKYNPVCKSLCRARNLRIRYILFAKFFLKLPEMNLLYNMGGIVP